MRRGADQSKAAIWWQRYRWPLAVTVVTLALTGIAYAITLDLAYRQARDRFEFRAYQITEAIRGRLESHIQVLRGGAALFDASDRVDRDDWERYVRGLAIDRLFPAFQGFGYSVRIPPGGLAAHESAVRAEGFPEYQVYPADERDEHHAIVFLEPFDWRNRRAFGYDMYTEPVRRAAMARARDTGQPATSGRVTLVQETDEDVQAGFNIYYPVYRRGAPTRTVAERRDALLGFVYSPVRVDNFLRGVLGERPIGVEFRLYDGPFNDPEALMHASANIDQTDGAFRSGRRIAVAGHEWTLTFHSRPVFEAQIDRVRPTLVLVTGLLIAALMFGIVRAVGELRRLNADLERRVAARTAELELANRELEEFASSVSHDLRGPLRAISGFCERLAGEFGEQLPERAAHYLSRIRGGASRMRQLIDDLLALAQVSRVPLTTARVDLAAVAREVVDELRIGEPLRQVQVTIEDVPPGYGDARMLRIVLENLIGNAWKFTSEKANAAIRFGATDDGDAYRWFVEDNGAGFDARYADQLFLPFQRLHKQSEFPGTGIGLATVARIIERHGGTLQAHGDPGHGATVSFTLGVR